MKNLADLNEAPHPFYFNFIITAGVNLNKVKVAFYPKFLSLPRPNISCYRPQVTCTLFPS